MTGTHDEVARANARAVEDHGITGVRRILLFGSGARGEAGPSADIDLFCVLDDEVDRRERTDQLRGIAFDLLLEYDTVIDVHTMAETRVRDREDHPFVRQVLTDGIAYA